MIQFEKCCGCVELKTACLIIGYLNLFQEGLLFLIGIVGLTDDEEMTVAQDEKEDKNCFRTIIFCLMCLVLLAFTIALLYGLNKNKPELVKAYLLTFAVSLAMFAIVLLYGIITRSDIRFKDVLDLIQLGLNTYFLLILNSQYVKMKEENNHGIAGSNNI